MCRALQSIGRRRPHLVLLLVALTVGSCGSAAPGGGAAAPAPSSATSPGGPSAGAPSEDRLRVGLFAWPTSWNPHLSTDAEDAAVYHQIFEGLVDVDPKLNMVGRLAESWSFSPDGTTLTFKLHKGVTWHDGKPFTAADVVFTHKSLTTWADASYRSLMEEVVSVTTPDDLTVVVRYKQPFAPALSTWSVPVIPAHRFPSGKSYEEASRDFPAIGTGPYKLAARIEGDSIVLARNPAYRRPVPYFAEISFKVMKDASTAVRSIRDGHLDVTRMRHADWKFTTEEGDWSDIIAKASCPTFGYSFIGWNQDGSNPYFQDRRVRRAMAMAFDNVNANTMYLSGLGQISYGPYPTSSTWFSPSVLNFPFDAVSAGRELDQAGWMDHDGDGIRDRDGLMFRFKLLTLEGALFTNEIAHILTEDLKKVGVRMEYVRVTYPEMMERIRSGKFEAFILEWSGDVDPDLYPIFHSSQHGSGLNFVGYVNPEADALMVQGRRELDQAKRNDIYRKLHEIIWNDQPYLFLFSMPTLWAVSSRLEGVEAQFGGLLTGYPGLLQWRATRPPAPLAPRARPAEPNPIQDDPLPAPPAGGAEEPR